MSASTVGEVRTAPDPALTSADVIRAAEELVPLLRERAVEVDHERRVSQDTYRRIGDAGLLHILKPRRYGGLELTDHDAALATMHLARGCASTAWVFSILSSDNMAILSFPEETQEEIWGVDSYATLAGNLNLNPAATVRRVDGGYRLTGAWGYCSGSDFSEWLIFNAPIEGAGHMLLVSHEETETIDDWYPTGLRGTGSRTIRVEDAFVPDRRVQPVGDVVRNIAERRSLHPGFDALWGIYPSTSRFTFAAVAVGAAWGAAEHFAATIGSSTRVENALGGAVRLADQDYVATEFAEAEGEILMARRLVERTSRDAGERASRHVEATEAEAAAEMRDNALVARIALRAVNRIYGLIGAKAGNPDHPVTRAKRDIEMVNHHVTLNWRFAAVRYLRSIAG